jgi:hypothetical protein
MILLISEHRDITTHKVIDWLKALKARYTVVYKESIFHDIVMSSDLKTFRLFIDTCEIDINRTNFIWYRRGDIDFNPTTNLIDNLDIRNAIIKHCTSEKAGLLDFIHIIFAQIPHVGSKSEKESNNKLANLLIARQVGFVIPEFKILSSKLNLHETLSSKQVFITKSIKEDLSVKTSNGYRFGTFGPSIVESTTTEKIGDSFFPTFLQEYIEKELEIRVFIFDKQYWSMAIFSQSDEATKLDYRNYSIRKPNRMTPLVLPDLRNRILHPQHLRMSHISQCKPNFSKRVPSLKMLFNGFHSIRLLKQMQGALYLVNRLKACPF